MKEIIKKIAKLIDVKSIITLSVMLLFFILALRGDITGEQVTYSFTMILGFYFGTQSQKKASDENGNKEA